ncbi:hypothetical protein vseg_021040 [Gypsophila vaccaria]
MVRNSKRRRKNEEEEEEDDEVTEKFRRVSKFFEIDAEEADDDDEDFDDEDFDGFLDDGPGEDIPDDYEDGEIGRRSPLVGKRDVEDEEEDVEEMEKMVNERYSRVAREYDHDFDDEVSEIDQQSLLPYVCDPKLWMVKCLPGHEREVAASLMQKSVDKGSELRILSAIALDHLQNYIYVEAHKEADVKEACKGMRYIFSKNVTMVPLKEMSNVLSVESTRVINVTIGDWVRLKRSSYKGSLAKVVDIDYVALKVTVKVAPKMSSLSLDDKLDGINSFYKTVSLSSVDTDNIQPSIEEVENFRDIGEDEAELATLFKGKHQECFLRGEAIMVVKGELKNLEGSVEYVEGDLVHIKPNVKIPMKTVTVRKTELVKHFRPGCHVKVVNGVHDGTTGMVVKVDQNKLIILSDASKDQITVLAGQVVKSTEASESGFVGVASYENREKPLNSSTSKHISNPAYASRPPPGPTPSSTGRVAGHFAKRRDSMIGKNVKIIQGPYRGYRGCIKGVNGNSIRVELEAQMKTVIVDRSHLSDKLPAPSTTWRMQQDRPGSETPLHPRTPMHSMGGETPWRTPRPSTPVHHGSACQRWNPFALVSPTRLTPTP